MKEDTKEWLEENPTLKRFEKKHPVLAAFLGKRFSKNKPYGRKFTGGLLLSLVLFLVFFEITFDVVSRESAALDQSITNFIYTFRNLSFAKYFLFFTDLGDVQGVLVLAVVLVLLFLMLGKKREALFSAFTLLFGEVSYAVIKLLVARPRPSLWYALVPRSGFSFPSGHSVGSVVFYGFGCYLISRMIEKKSAKAFWWFLAAFIPLNIGLSRIYLGVHWASDVLGGWTLGLAIAVLSVFLMKELESRKPMDGVPVFQKQSIYRITAGLLALAVVFIVYFYDNNPLEYKIPPSSASPVIVSATSSIESLVARSDFPKFSESIAGDPMEPMSLIVVGSEASLKQAFSSEGWVVADPPTTANFIKLGLAAIEGKPYPAAPASPSFLNAEPQLITFEKNVGGTFIVRHHTRFWQTKFLYAGQPVWVASASFDSGLTSYLVYHQISPAIDTERDYIASDLLRSGLVTSELEVQFVHPMMGENFADEPFFTNGKAYIIFLRNS
jgi:undecaprenyl-diphosphatase